MRVAFYQSHIIWEDKERNLQKLSDCLQKCKEDHVQLLLLPEMSLTGFSMHTEVTKEKNHQTIAKIQELSKKYQIAIGIGWVKDLLREDQLCENHYSVVQGEEILLDYAKIHPFSFSDEEQYFLGGTKLFTCDLFGFRLGALICYDLRFPEVFQKLSDRVDLIVLPANWPEKRRDHWRCLLQARAIENQCYILGVNCGGEIGGLFYSGDSTLLNPTGEKVVCDILWQNETCKEEILYVTEIENNVQEIRDTFPTKKDRKENLYMTL